MRYLLDTHTLIWFLEGDSKLSAIARKAIEGEGNACFVSIASFWEMAIKLSLGKLDIKRNFESVRDLARENNFEIIPIRFEHALYISQLPFFHKDPFDRIIIAQSIIEGMELISADESFKDYSVKILW